MADQEMSPQDLAYLQQFMQKLSQGPNTQPQGAPNALQRGADISQMLYRQTGAGPKGPLMGSNASTPSNTQFTPEQTQATEKDPTPPSSMDPESPEMKQYLQALLYTHRNDKQTYDMLQQKIAAMSNKAKAPHTKEGI